MIYNNNASRFRTIQEARAAYLASDAWKRTKAACPECCKDDGEVSDAYMRGAFEQWLFRDADADEMAATEKRIRDNEAEIREMAENSTDPKARELAREWLKAFAS